MKVNIETEMRNAKKAFKIYKFVRLLGVLIPVLCLVDMAVRGTRIDMYSRDMYLTILMYTVLYMAVQGLWRVYLSSIVSCRCVDAETGEVIDGLDYDNKEHLSSKIMLAARTFAQVVFRWFYDFCGGFARCLCLCSVITLCAGCIYGFNGNELGFVLTGISVSLLLKVLIQVMRLFISRMVGLV